MERLSNRQLTAQEARDFTAASILRILDYHAESGGHTEITYEVLTPSPEENKKIQCSQCSLAARFLQWTRDHRAQIFIAGSCNKHASERWHNLVIEKESS